MSHSHNSRNIEDTSVSRCRGIVLLLPGILAAVIALSGCSLLPTEIAQEQPPATPSEDFVADEPAPNYIPPEDSTPASSDLADTAQTPDEQRIVFYGEVLSYRYGVEVSEAEWLQVRDKACTSFSSGDSTRIYGPAAADNLDSEQRDAFMLESFVFVVTGSYYCDAISLESNFDRYNQQAGLISLAFMTTINSIGDLDPGVSNFARYYDNQLTITRDEFAAPEYPGYDAPPPEDTEPYPEVEYPGPYTEYEGNAGGPTYCEDGTISNSSGQGTCSHHGGEQ